MLLKNKALIYCILGSHNEFLMHYLGYFNLPDAVHRMKFSLRLFKI
jgi:hypothetical protein